MPDNTNGSNRGKLLRKKTILSEVPIDDGTLWTWIKQGKFPPPVVLNPGQKREIVAWREADYLAWRDSLPQRLATPTSDRIAGRGRPRKQLVTRPGE